MSVSDAVLVAGATRGDRDALAALYERHASAVYTLALRLLGNPSDAEDVLQDVFLGLTHALDRYSEQGAFAAWLLRITARSALARARNRRPDESLRADHPQRPSDHGTRMDIDAALAVLPNTLRTPFVLRAVEGFSHDEIAALLDISPANAMQRYSRACKQLRSLLDRV
ncbi:MAG: sigma-70 family RNA polymerase sigma factor [bacterium]